MKTSLGSKLGIAMKLTLGLGSLILISVIVGGLAIVIMTSVQGSSGDLAVQYLPEISVTN